jgi:Cdc6-like AAA superfamily ATPase
MEALVSSDEIVAERGVGERSLASLAELSDAAYSALGCGVVASTRARLHILVVDECDALLQKARDAVETIFHWPHASGSRVVLIAVSNAIDLCDRGLPSLRQHGCVPARAVFSAYSAAALALIIHERLSHVPGTPEPPRIVDPKGIELLSKRLAGTDGDLRKALFITRRAVLIAAMRYCTGAAAAPLQDDSTLSDILKEIAGAAAASDDDHGGDNDGCEAPASAALAPPPTTRGDGCSCRVNNVMAWESAPESASGAAAAASSGAGAAPAAIGAYAVGFADVRALMSAAFDSPHARVLRALPRSAQVLVCAARGLAEKVASTRATDAAFAVARAAAKRNPAAGGGSCASLHLGSAATGSGTSVSLTALKDAFTRLCRKQLLTTVDDRDFTDLLDRLEASGLVAFLARVGRGGGAASSGAGGRIKHGGDRVTGADAWAQG